MNAWIIVGLIVCAGIAGYAVDHKIMDGKIAEMQLAQQKVVSAQQGRNIKALQDQNDTDQKTGEEYEKKLRDGASQYARLYDLWMRYKSKPGANPLPGIPAPAGCSAPTTAESSSNSRIDEATGRVIKACISDFTELQSLIDWNRKTAGRPN